MSKSEFETKYHQIYAKLCKELEMGKGDLLSGFELSLIDNPVHDDQRLRKDFFNKLLFFGSLFLSGVCTRKALNKLIHSFFHKYFSDLPSNLHHL